MNKLTPKLLTAFRSDFEKAIVELKNKYECEIKLGKIRYDETSFSMPIDVTNRGEDVYVNDYKSRCHLYGLNKDWLGKSIKLNGRDFTVYGIDRKARKQNVIIVETKSGSMMKTTPDAIYNKFGGPDYFNGKMPELVQTDMEGNLIE